MPDQTKILALRGSLGKGVAPSASTTYQIFPYYMTTKGTDKIQKSGCDCESHQVIVTPTLITTPINTPVIVRYDASSICWKQSIFDPVTGEPHPYVDGVGNNSVIGNITLGTVQWEVGSVFNLPLE